MMNRPAITITKAIELAISHAGIENDDPCCVYATYEDDFFALTVYTTFQQYEFYVCASEASVVGMSSAPVPPTEDLPCGVCA